MIGSNTTIVLDVGRNDCKVAQYSVAGVDIKLLKRDVFTPMDCYMSGDRLGQIGEFVTDMIKFFSRSGFTGTKIAICGSVFEITSTVQDWAYEDTKELPKLYEEKVSKGLSNLKTASWQFYGTELKDNATLAKVIVSEVKTEAINAITNEFAMNGYTVVTLNDDIVSTFNLIKLSQDTYERPSRFILNFGTKITAYTVIKNNPMDKFNLSCSFQGLISVLSKSLGVPTDIAGYALFKAGFIDDEISKAHLHYAGVSENEYFRVLIEFSKELARELKQALDTKANNYKVGKYRIMLIGGYSTIPGIEQALSSVFGCEVIELTSLIDEGYEFVGGRISSAPGQLLEPAYIQTLGCMLGTHYKPRCNLVGATKQLVDLSGLARLGMPVLCGILGLVLFANGISAITLIGELKDTKQKASEVSTLTSRIEQYTVGVQSLDANLTVIDSVSDLVPRLIEFTNNFDNSKLMIASIDSESILKPPEVTNDQITDEMLDVTPDTPAEPDAGEAGAIEGDVLAVPQLTTGSQTYYIRGYSRDYNTAIAYFDSLSTQTFLKDISLSGIDRVSLPSKEELYLFEIVVGG